MECLRYNFRYPGRYSNPDLPRYEGVLLIPPLCSVYLSYLKHLYKFFIKCGTSLQVRHCLVEWCFEHGECGVLGVLSIDCIRALEFQFWFH